MFYTDFLFDLHKSSAALRRLAFFLTTLLVVTAGCKQSSETNTASEGGTSQTLSSTFGIDADSTKLEVGVVTVGPVADWGYNYQHNQGRLAMEARLRDKVHTVVVENVPENADAERVMQRMCDSGAGLIFSTSYGYADISKRVAAKNPDVKFMQALSSENAPNLGTMSLRVWEPAYVAGAVAAASLEGETRFGFLAAHPVPPINWTVNAFCLGARSVNPKVTVDIVYTNSWYDPAAETEATKSLIAKGVKAIYVLTDSPIAGVQAAEAGGVHSLAHFADLSSFAPKKWLTGSVWQWSALYRDVAQEVLDGNWEGKYYGGGFKEGYVGMAPYGQTVTPKARETANELIGQISDGSLNVFAGPIRDAEGNVRVPEGKSSSVDEILSMDWVVDGVRGAPTQTMKKAG